jgi:hypothetical protein
MLALHGSSAALCFLKKEKPKPIRCDVFNVDELSELATFYPVQRVATIDLVASGSKRSKLGNNCKTIEMAKQT